MDGVRFHTGGGNGASPAIHQSALRQHCWQSEHPGGLCAADDADSGTGCDIGALSLGQNVKGNFMVEDSAGMMPAKSCCHVVPCMNNIALSLLASSKQLQLCGK